MRRLKPFYIIFSLLFYFSLQQTKVSAAIVFQDDNFATVDSNGITLDDNNTVSSGGAIVLQFGRTLSSSVLPTLKWDESVTPNRFVFSHGLDIGSNNLFVNGTTGLTMLGGVTTPNTRVDINGDFAIRKSDLALSTPTAPSITVFDNLIIGNNSFIRLTGLTGPITITGLDIDASGANANPNGRVVTIYNSTTQNVTFSNSCTTAPCVANNAILTLNGANIVGSAQSMHTFIYDSNGSRWIMWRARG